MSKFEYAMQIRRFRDGEFSQPALSEYSGIGQGRPAEEPIMRARERKYRFNCRSHRMKTALTVAEPHLPHHTHAIDRRGLGLADAMPGQCDERVPRSADSGRSSEKWN